MPQLEKEPQLEKDTHGRALALALCIVWAASLIWKFLGEPWPDKDLAAAFIGIFCLISFDLIVDIFKELRRIRWLLLEEKNRLDSLRKGATDA
jgi:hypothetical protein